MARAIGINHVALEVGDLEAAVAFWRALFPELELRGRAPGMAFVDLGDQFVALAEAREIPPAGHRHFGLVVDDVEAVLARARDAGADVRRNDVLDPWGNVLQIVGYADVQFTKADAVLRAQGASGIEKSERALEELRAKGIEP